jgi:transposase
VLKTKITDNERNTLQAYSKTSPLNLVRQKCFAILIADQELGSSAIAKIVGKTKRSIDRWIKDWNSQRLASIFTGHKDNTNAAKLTKEQKEHIKTVLAQPPHAQGIPSEFWDVPTLKEYVSAQFGVVYESPESYYFLLRFSGLSFKYPDTFDLRRNEQLIAERMKEIKAELAPMLADNSWEFFACDEVKMQQDAIIRKAWLKKGERTIVKVNRKKDYQSYIGFLNQKNGACEVYEMPWQNSEEVLKTMKLFLANHPNKKICVVWDNAPFHKSKAIRDQLAKGGIMERVHLIAMPPYAPDNNPIEHVWNTAKKAVANIQRNTFAETKQAFSDFVASRQFNYLF